MHDLRINKSLNHVFNNRLWQTYKLPVSKDTMGIPTEGNENLKDTKEEFNT